MSACYWKMYNFHSLQSADV